MRAVVQRVREASVRVDAQVVGEIGPGLLVLVGVKHGDGQDDARLLARKITQLRILPDESGKMNRSVSELGGDILIVSQFTLYGDTRKGNRPSFSEAAPAEVARPLYEYFVDLCRKENGSVATGIFQADMEVFSINWGPVTLLCSTDT